MSAEHGTFYDRHPRLVNVSILAILAAWGLATEIVPMMDYDKQVETPTTVPPAIEFDD